MGDLCPVGALPGLRQDGGPPQGWGVPGVSALTPREAYVRLGVLVGNEMAGLSDGELQGIAESLDAPDMTSEEWALWARVTEEWRRRAPAQA